MPLYMYQATYTAEAWSTQLKKPEGRIETVSRANCKKIGGKFIGAWYAFGEYDAVIIVEAPDAASMASVALAIAAGGSDRIDVRVGRCRGHDEGGEAGLSSPQLNQSTCI
jgi:uncharacterized protein with GYD domain